MEIPGSDIMRSEPGVEEGFARDLLALVCDFLCICRSGTIVWVNDAGAAVIGQPAESLCGRPFTHLLHPDHAAALGDGLHTLTEEPGGQPLMMRREPEGIFPAQVSARSLGPDVIAIHARDLAGRAAAADTLAVAIARIEKRSRELMRLSRHAALSARVFETASEGIMVLDAGLRVTAINPAFTQITGYNPGEVVGRKPPMLLNFDTEADAKAALFPFEAAQSTGRWQGERWSLRKDGERYGERVGISTVTEDDGTVLQYVVVFSDITQRKLDEERIRRQASYDTLTGLPNRALFLDRLDQAVRNAERGGHMVCLMFIDLDGFKLVNDTLGHDMGDLLLQEAGNRLAACVRSGDTVARLGGDEFTVIMPNLDSHQNAPLVASRILDALARPFDLAGREAFISGSIGITIYPDDADTATIMLKNADAAMYRAKDHGKANFQFFTADLNAAIEERLAIKTGLTKALENDELALHFQPKLDLVTREISGVEALLRWNSGDLGAVTPSRFIPVMEEAGLMGRVGEWAIAAACRQHRQWREAGLAPLRIAINLSVRQLHQHGFVEMVERSLETHGISADALEFEITEDMVMKDSANAVAVLQRLSDLGIRLAMDDFGTGYSSLSVIKRFPVDSIKIDRVFIADLGSGGDELVRTIINMGHSMGRHVIAEGVETEQQLSTLTELACDEIQGFVLCPPLPAADVSRFMAEYSTG